MQRADRYLGTGPAGRGRAAPARAATDEDMHGLRRVLIVEDEVLIVLELERALTAAGFEVVGAGTLLFDEIGAPAQ